MYPPRWPLNNSGNEHAFSPWNLSLKNMCHWGDPLLTDFSGMTKMLIYIILYIMTWTQIYPKHPKAKTKATEILDIMDRWSLRWPRRRQRPRACSSSTATREMGRKDSLMMPNANKTMRKQWEYVENGGQRSKSWWHRIVILDYPDTSRHPRSCLQDS